MRKRIELPQQELASLMATPYRLHENRQNPAPPKWFWLSLRRSFRRREDFAFYPGTKTASW